MGEASDSFNEGDSLSEMALISRAFEETARTMSSSGAQEGIMTDPCTEGFESTGRSSLDATLSELRIRRRQTSPIRQFLARCPKRSDESQLEAFP